MIFILPEFKIPEYIPQIYINRKLYTKKRPVILQSDRESMIDCLLISVD